MISLRSLRLSFDITKKTKRRNKGEGLIEEEGGAPSSLRATKVALQIVVVELL